MIRVAVQPTAYIPEILDDSPPTHSDTYNPRYLEPLSGSNCARQIPVRSFQEFVVVSAQGPFPTEACRPRYLLIPFRKENVNQTKLQVGGG
jgi:hypothetical protein